MEINADESRRGRRRNPNVVDLEIAGSSDGEPGEASSVGSRSHWLEVRSASSCSLTNRDLLSPGRRRGVGKEEWGPDWQGDAHICATFPLPVMRQRLLRAGKAQVHLLEIPRIQSAHPATLSRNRSRKPLGNFKVRWYFGSIAWDMISLRHNSLVF